MKTKYITREKIGLILVTIGLLLALITILIVSFNSNIVFGIIMLGLYIAAIGGLLLLKD